MVRLHPGRNIVRLTEIEQESDQSETTEAQLAAGGAPSRVSRSVRQPECHPDELWVRCPRCRELLYTKENEQSLRVCSKCKFHAPVSAQERICMVLDGATFSAYGAGPCSADPLSYVSMAESCADQPRYSDQVDINGAFLYGTGTIEGQAIVIGAADFRFCSADMGTTDSETVVRAIELAERQCLPLVLFSSGGGARVQEGVVSLLQTAQTLAGLNRFKDAGLPYLSILTDPCLGGITASYGLLGDVNIAEPGAYIGFAGRRVIQQTTRQELPHDVATAEFLERHGMVDLVVPRAEIRRTLARLLRVYVGCNPRVREKQRMDGGDRPRNGLPAHDRSAARQSRRSGGSTVS